MDKPSQTEWIIRRLYQVTSDYQKGFDIQILQLLMLGLEQYNLDIAILSNVENEKYKVIQCVTPEEIDINQGDFFEYEETYCALTCRSHQPVAVEYAGSNPVFANHPAYKSCRLECYIGVPIYLNDELYGTLNFSSMNIRHEPFSQSDIDLIRLMASWVESELLRHKQERELLSLNQQLEYQANFDLLTKIPNRRQLFETINRQMEQVSYAGGEGTIVIIDLDYFKMVNDTFGHQKGDEVLKEVAQRLKNCIGKEDFIARFGGEEFVVWLPDSTMESRQIKIDRLMKSTRHIILNEHCLTISAGACHFSCVKGSTPAAKDRIDKILSCADKALYEAKSTGRDKVVYCQESFN